jgi:hypothetical protein
LPEQTLSDPSHAELTTTFYCLIYHSPNLEGQVPVFISSRNRVAQLYPQALGSLFVASWLTGLRWRYSNLHTGGLKFEVDFGFFMYGALSDERTGQ